MNVKTVKRLKRFGLASTISLTMGLMAVSTALAAGGESSGNIASPTPLGLVTAQEYIGRVINVIFGVSGIAAMIVFVYAGANMMLSQGNSSQYEKSKTMIFWASVGLMGIFGSYAAVRFVVSKLGD